MDPEAGPHRPTFRAGRVPRHADARLQKRFGVVDKEHRLADVGLGADDPVLIKGVIRGPPVDFLHHVGHLVPQAQAHREIRAELDFILEIPGSFQHAEGQRRRTRVRLHLGRPILQHRQQGGVGERARVILIAGIQALLDGLEPYAHAQAVTPFGHAQIIGRHEVLSGTVKGVLAVGRREGRRLGRGRSASNDQRARSLSFFSLHKEQAIGEWLVGSGYLVCPRAGVSKGHRIHNGGGNNMRFLRAERIETAALLLDDNRVRLRIGPEPPVRAETGREGIPGGHGEVKPRQAEIFIHRPPGIAVIVSGASGQAVLKQLRTILRRPVPEKR